MLRPFSARSLLIALIVAPAVHAETVAAPPATSPPQQEPEAPSLTPLTVTTSTWSRFEAREGYDALGVSRGRFVEGDAVFYRARLGLRTNPLSLGDDWVGLVQLSPQASGRLGLTGTTTEAALGIYEGYFRLASPRFALDVGRFMMNYGDALVIGNLDWNQVGRAFDGGRVRWSLPDAAFVDAFVTFTAPDGVSWAEGHPTVNSPFLAGDFYFWGVYAGLGPLLTRDLALDVYVLGNSNVPTTGLPNTADPTGPLLSRGGAAELTFGSRVKQTYGALDYRLEAGMQTGKRSLTSVAGGAQQVFAYQVDGEIGYSPSSRVRLGVNGIIASGDDPNTAVNEGWHQLYPTGHKFLGLTDVIGDRTNVGSVVLKGNARFTESLSFLLDAHFFTRLEDGGLGQVGPDRVAGYEIDTQLLQKFGKPGYARGLYGIFIPGADHYATRDPVHYVEIEGGLVF